MMKTNTTYNDIEEGFTLIELMIVVAIIGLLVAIAFPNYLNYQCKTKQSEAKYSLGIIRTSQESYFAEYDTYASSLISISFRPKNDARYSYSIVNSSTVSYTAQASGTINNKADEWQIIDSGTLTNTQPGCTN